MSQTRSPLVSVIVLNWNSRKHIFRCLECLFGQDYPALEVIVIDNGSSDGSYESIREWWGDRIVMRRNERNVGFPAGMNQGIACASGEYVLLLNADFFLSPSFLRRAVEAAGQHASAGMVAGIVFKDVDERPSTEIDSVGWYLERYLAVANSKNMHENEWVFGPAGSAQFIRRAALEEARLPDGDYLDSRYFAYGEDIELFLRLQMLGWRCLFIPVIAGSHTGSGSVEGTRHIDKPDALQIHAIKNRFFTVLACYPVRLCMWTLPWQLAAEIGQLGYMLARGRGRFGANWLRALGMTMAALPYIYRKRRWLQQRRRVTFAYLRGLFVEQTPREALRSLLAKS